MDMTDEPYRPWRVWVPSFAAVNAAREAVQTMQWRLAYGRAAVAAAAARESRAVAAEIVDDLLDCVMEEKCECCICYNVCRTYLPMCETHMERACASCVLELRRLGQTCALCREPLAVPGLRYRDTFFGMYYYYNF